MFAPTVIHTWRVVMFSCSKAKCTNSKAHKNGTEFGLSCCLFSESPHLVQQSSSESCSSEGLKLLRVRNTARDETQNQTHTVTLSPLHSWSSASSYKPTVQVTNMLSEDWANVDLCNSCQHAARAC